MTPTQVVALLAAVAEAFGLDWKDLLGFAQQKHPELVTTPLPKLGRRPRRRVEHADRDSLPCTVRDPRTMR